jgi:hypothetical protein
VTLPTIEKMVADEDSEVREVAFLSLAQLVDPEGSAKAPLAGDPRVPPLGAKGLADASEAVQFAAAVTLALVRDDAGAGVLSKSMDRAELARIGIADPDAQRLALFNAIKGAWVLGGEALKARVERLADPGQEGDDAVRQTARKRLERWRTH